MKESTAASAATDEQQVLRLARTRAHLRAPDLTQHKLPTITLMRPAQADKLARVARCVDAAKADFKSKRMVVAFDPEKTTPETLTKATG